MIEIKKIEIPFLNSKVQALLIVPNELKTNTITIFSHGYTSHKASIISWGFKLADFHIPSIIFDLPGHYLGSFNEVDHFCDFENHAHNLFYEAAKIMISDLAINPQSIILGGHSLGGLLAIKAIENPYFDQFKRVLSLGVGVGLPEESSSHVFQTAFFESMLKKRAQLVSKSIAPELMFNWISEEKASIKTKNKEVYLLTGNDDIIAPPKNIKHFKKILEVNNNQVMIEVKKNLPHHLPEMAATHIKNFLKNQGLL